MVVVIAVLLVVAVVSRSTRLCLHVPIVEGIDGKAATRYPSGDRQQTGEALTHEREAVEPPAACTSETAPARSGLMLSGTTSKVVSILPMPPTVT